MTFEKITFKFQKSYFIEYYYDNNLYICLESSFFTCSFKDNISTFDMLLPNRISTMSPALTSVPGFAIFSLTFTLPWEHAALAIVLLLINLEFLRYLSILKPSPPHILDNRGPWPLQLCVAFLFYLFF